MKILQAKPRLSVLSLIGILLVAGCTASQVDLAIKASPAVNAFTSEYPNAKISTSLISQATVSAQLTEIRKDCEDFQVGNYYKTILNDEASGTKLTVWLNADNYQVICAVRERAGVKTPVENVPITTTTQATTTTLQATTTTSCTTPTIETILSFRIPPTYLNVDGSKHKIVSIGSTSATTAILKIDDGSETTHTKGISYNAGTPSFSFKFINTTYGTYQTGDNQKDKVTLQISGTCNAAVCPIYKNILSGLSPITVTVGGKVHTIELIAVLNSSAALLKTDGIVSDYLKFKDYKTGTPPMNIMLANVTMTSVTGDERKSSAELWIFEDTC